MTVRHVSMRPQTREGLNAAWAYSPPHLRPIIEAVRDRGAAMLFVGQSATPFRIPKDSRKPAIVLLGDDFDHAVGPEGFHLPSVRRAMRACQAFAVVSSGPLAPVYASIAGASVIGRCNVMLIETRIDQEIPWLAMVQKLAPRRHVLLSTVKGGHA